MILVLIGLGIVLSIAIATAVAILAARRLSNVMAIALAVVLPPIFAWLVFDVSFELLLPELVAEPGPASADDGPLIFAGAMILGSQAAILALLGGVAGSCIAVFRPKKRGEADDPSAES